MDIGIKLVSERKLKIVFEGLKIKIAKNEGTKIDLTLNIIIDGKTLRYNLYLYNQTGYNYGRMKQGVEDTSFVINHLN